jgi:hypothetical protein
VEVSTVRPETFREIADAMRPAPSGIAAEADLIHARRVHQDCGADGFCECGLLRTAGAFYMTVSAFSVARHLDDVRDLLLEEWVGLAMAYDAGDDISDLAFRMYATAVTFRLLPS